MYTKEKLIINCIYEHIYYSRHHENKNIFISVYDQIAVLQIVKPYHEIRLKRWYQWRKVKENAHIHNVQKKRIKSRSEI